MSAIPVHVVTGFLGSGKTTLLNRLLAAPGLRDTAVIVNEFGAIPLDHHLVEGVAGETVVLANGCVCCTVRGDLAAAMVDLVDRAGRGEIPAFRRILLETTGLADPAPILGTLESHPAARHHVRRGLVVTTVDAVNAPAALAGEPEAVRQIAAADRLMLTKTDMVSDAEAAAVGRAARAINPLAPLGRGEVAALLDLLAAADRGAEGLLPLAAAGLDAEFGAGHDHAGHAGGVSSFTLVRAAPVAWQAFAAWLTLLLHAHGEAILRVKGVLAVAGEALPLFVQGVRHVVHRPQHLAAWPDGDRRTRLVFIVRGIDAAAVRRSFDRVAVLGQGMP